MQTAPHLRRGPAPEAVLRRALIGMFHRYGGADAAEDRINDVWDNAVEEFERGGANPQMKRDRRVEAV